MNHLLRIKSGLTPVSPLEAASVSQCLYAKQYANRSLVFGFNIFKWSFFVKCRLLTGSVVRFQQYVQYSEQVCYFGIFVFVMIIISLTIEYVINTMNTLHWLNVQNGI